MKTKHTELPVQYFQALENNAPNYYAITTGKWGAPTIAKLWDKANAEFITRACNSHYELLEVLKAVLSACEENENSLIHAPHWNMAHAKIGSYIRSTGAIKKAEATND